MQHLCEKCHQVIPLAISCSCTLCGEVFYCSKSCRRTDRRSHNKFCGQRPSRKLQQNELETLWSDLLADPQIRRTFHSVPTSQALIAYLPRSSLAQAQEIEFLSCDATQFGEHFQKSHFSPDLLLLRESHLSIGFIVSDLGQTHFALKKIPRSDLAP